MEDSSQFYKPKDLSDNTRAVLIRTFLVSSILLLAGCYDQADDRMYPYRFEKAWYFGPMHTVVDLDYDGEDEIIYRFPTKNDEVNEAWLFAESDGSVIDEQAIPGNVISRPSFGDIDPSTRELEVLIPVNRNDSLFLYAFDKSTTSVRPPIYIASGKKRVDEDGTTYDWEARAIFNVIDVDGDGTKELVSIVSTTYARLPRGIFVHDLSTGTEIGNEIVGAAIQEAVFVQDVDSDGRIEIGFASGTPNNGSIANELNDADGHLVIFELARDPIIEWHKTVEMPRTKYRAHVGNFLSSSPLELLLFNVGTKSTEPSGTDILIYDLTTSLNDQIPFNMSFPDQMMASVETDMEGDGESELFLLDTNSRLIRLDHLQTTVSRTFDKAAWSVLVIPDFTGDGRPEIEVKTVEGGALFLNQSFDTIAMIDSTSIYRSLTLKDGNTRYLSTGGNSFSIVRNRYFLWSRYKEEALFPLGLIAFVFLFQLGHRRGQKKVHREIRESLLKESRSDTEALFTSARDKGKRALFVLEDRYADSNFDVKCWAEETGYKSTRQLERILKKVTGSTPEKLLWIRRVNEGHELISNASQHLSISEIAYQVGFSDPSHFTRKYREVFGSVPSEIRHSSDSSS